MPPVLPLLLLLLALAPARAAAVTRGVPVPYPTIQAAIDASASGDVIEVQPGTYAQALTISGKTLTIQSRFATSGDPADIEATRLSAGGVDNVTLLAGADVLLRGFVVENGQAAVRANIGCRIELADGHVRNTSDGISLEGGSAESDGIVRGVIRRSLIEGSSDDGVDSDNKTSVWIEDSEIRDNEDDGMELRLHDNDYAPGESPEIVILRSRFTGNGADGIQLIEYAGLSARTFRIEHTIFANNALAGLGIPCASTTETFEGCQMPEPLRLMNNSFIGNDHGLVGGANAIGVNNLFVGNTTLGVKNVATSSLLVESLFFGNGTDHTGSNLDLATTLFADPLLTAAHLLQDGSPAIDAGLAFYQVGSEVIVNRAPTEYGGAAPDLGALEWIPGTGAGPLVVDVRVAAGSDDAEQGPSTVALTGSDLELGVDGTTAQTVGLRFLNVGIPPGAPILDAWIQFQADETGASAASLLVEGQAADDPGTFTSAAGNVSSRPRTLAEVAWAPPAWTAVGLAGAAQRTPDLSEIVQELVDRPGWASSNAMVFLVTGTGTRTAEPFDTTPGGAALLHVEYATAGCGNGFVDPGETCDDGNTLPGDGCDGSCQLSLACSDGIDNDGDAHLDHPLDPGCEDPSDDDERAAELACDDGVDNDGDGGLDWTGDENGDGSSDAPGDLGCAGPAAESESPACQDGADNEGDARLDFDGGASVNGGTPTGDPDPHCAGPTDPSEAAPFTGGGGCGLGPELLPVLLAMRLLRRRL